MKAVIVEIKDKFAAVLFSDGRIKKLHNQNYAIGQVIEIKPKLIFKSKKITAIVTSAAALVLCLGTGAWAYMTPYYYVSLDVNPSIEYAVNRFDRVLSVKAVNDDGKMVLEQADSANLINLDIGEAVNKVVYQLSADGYFDGEPEGGIVIATAGENPEKAKALATKLERTVARRNQANGDAVRVEAQSVSWQRVREAKALGATPGKLNLVKKLKASASDPASVKVDEWLHKPVKTIMKAIKDNRKAAGLTGNTNLGWQLQNHIQSETWEQNWRLKTQNQPKREKVERKPIKARKKAQLKETRPTPKLNDPAKTWPKGFGGAPVVTGGSIFNNSNAGPQAKNFTRTGNDGDQADDKAHKAKTKSNNTAKASGKNK